MPILNRWWIAIAGVCMQMALGSAYAWSVFRIPLSKEFGWSITQITWIFLISWFFLGMQHGCRRLVDETQGPEDRRDDGGAAVGRRSISRQFFRQQTLVALSDVRSHWGNRPGHGLHRPDYRAGEMVSRPPGTHHRNCGGRVRRGSFVLRARRGMVDPACGIDADVCVPRSCVRGGRHCLRRIHAKSARRLDAGTVGRRPLRRSRSVPIATTRWARRWAPGNGGRSAS